MCGSKLDYGLFNCWVQVAEAEEKTAGGLLLTEASKEKPSIGTVRVGNLLHFE